MKEKLIILTIVIYLFNLLFVHAQNVTPYEALKLNAHKTVYSDHFYDRTELKQQNNVGVNVEVIPVFGGNSVTKTLQYESGIFTELKIAIHNQSNVITNHIPYYASISVGWSNLSLPDELGRKTYDYSSYGLELGTWYEQFLIYGFLNWNSNRERAYGAYGIGGGIKLPVSNLLSVNVMGELGKIVFDSPFVNPDNKNYYQSLSIGLGIKIF